MKTRAGLASLLLTLSACGPQVQPKKAAEVVAEPVTGLHALYQMFAASRAWAPDTQIYKLTSMHVEGVKPQSGKAGAWQVRFISPSLQQARTYTFSVIDASASLLKGINSSKAEGWSGAPGSTHPFLIQAAKKDSDEAWAVAIKKGAEYDAKNPGMTITYEMELTTSYNNAVWRVMWGESAGTSGFSVLVDATTGAYVETLR